MWHICHDFDLPIPARKQSYVEFYQLQGEPKAWCLINWCKEHGAQKALYHNATLCLLHYFKKVGKLDILSIFDFLRVTNHQSILAVKKLF